MRKKNVIRSHKHQIFTETVNKIALSANDYKRIILEDKISTLAYGHFNLGERRMRERERAWARGMMSSNLLDVRMSERRLWGSEG